MDAVIMTGGKGTRMAPHTKVLPKGLLPIDDGPILEIIIKQLSYYGFKNITMACGYLAPLIQTYFGNGDKWDISIQYEIEDEPLGTCGPLKNLTLNKPFLVINCDVLTTLDFKQFKEFHEAGNSLLTIASQKKKVSLDLGVLETQGEKVTHFLEKPSQTSYVSMGIYMMDPKVEDYIPDNQFFDVPDLIHALLKDRKEVRHFENEAFWMDIGRPAEFEQAKIEFKKMKTKLLPGERE